MPRIGRKLVLTAMMMSSVALVAQLELEIDGGEHKTISQSDFKKLPHQTLMVTNPHTQTQDKFEGVPLRTLLDQIAVSSGKGLRGSEMRDYFVVTAKDGYKVVLALAEIDPMFQPNQVLVADSIDGKPLDDKHGPLQLIEPKDQRPGRWVRMINKISVRRAP